MHTSSVIIQRVPDAEQAGIVSLTYTIDDTATGRRRTDITPASRAYDSSMFPPTSPKIHELLERQSSHTSG